MVNSSEIALLLSELPLKNSVIQGVREHDYHSFTLELFSQEEKAWLLYVEVGTARQRFSKTERQRPKNPKTQRFGQFLRKNLIGCRIKEVKQVPGERFFTFTLTHYEVTTYLHFRFYSGSFANVVLTDSALIILDLMFRRPAKGEVSGAPFSIPEERNWDYEKYPVRAYTGPSFNRFMDEEATKTEDAERKETLLEQIGARKEKDISSILTKLKSAEEAEIKSRDFSSYKETGDLLSSNFHLMKKGESSVLFTALDGKTVSVSLDEKLSPSENINAYYKKYKRMKRIHENALEEMETLKAKKAECERFYEALVEDGDERRLEKALSAGEKPKGKTENSFGLCLCSRGFEILVGRNAKENDEILRRHTRGADLWLHVRDFSGGYVIIKAKKDKSVPLEVLLDAANLAIHYSRAKKERRVDLYYTEVKYLRRAKDGKKGLVLPTQEKNLSVAYDESRVRALLGESK